MTALKPRTDPRSVVSGHPVWTRKCRQTAVHYVALTKPRIIELLLVTTFPTMFLAQRGHEAVNVTGGMLAWEAEGRPMTTEGPGPARVV